MHVIPEKHQFQTFLRQLYQERRFHPAVFLCCIRRGIHISNSDLITKYNDEVAWLKITILLKKVFDFQFLLNTDVSSLSSHTCKAVL